MRVNQRTLPWLSFTIEQSLYTLLLQKTIEGLNCNTWVPFSTHLKKSRARENWIGWWSNCWLFGAWFLQSGTTSAFWWLERLDSISWVNNQIYSTGLCVLLNYKCKDVREWVFFFCWKHNDDSKHSIFLDHVHWVQKTHKSETLTWSMRVTIDGISVMVYLKRRGGA